MRYVPMKSSLKAHLIKLHAADSWITKNLQFNLVTVIEEAESCSVYSLENSYKLTKLGVNTFNEF